MRVGRPVTLLPVMSTLNTASIPLATGTHDGSLDPYLVSRPAPQVNTTAKVVWWIGQIVTLASVNLFGVGVMLIAIHFAVFASPEQTVPELGRAGMELLPYGVAGVLAGLFYRKWSKRVSKQAPSRARVQAAVLGTGPAAGVYLVSYLLSWAAIIVVAIFAGL